MYKTQIKHLLACKVAARLSAVIAGSTCWRCWRRARRLAAGNWVNGNSSFSLSIDDLSALTSNSTKSKSLPLPSYIGSTYLTSSSCFLFSHNTNWRAGFVCWHICIPDLFGYFRRSSRSNSMAVLINIHRPLTSCNGMFYWMFTDSWANRIQTSKHAMAKRQYCRCAREP